MRHPLRKRSPAVPTGRPVTKLSSGGPAGFQYSRTIGIHGRSGFLSAGRPCPSPWAQHPGTAGSFSSASCRLPCSKGLPWSRDCQTPEHPAEAQETRKVRTP
ncbi:MAG: hypothetical protein VR74_01390 [Hyphomonas sp. BRH_c22]|nr:MAG: hypothetical protein VR74_01390 [Hyphomonas sp. BRH_c22]